ncbi:hypothetical protein D6D22_10741 [Aureobasidium pullulans]|uniref:Uncharacterized protein n=1 Tax=Aureobasidium pullulans TaxID=5580 RepID=A0A4S8WNC2_AURPU|nr:hypothetical protein D6D22_10741 [Aureobasidium pullulans]
MINDLRHEVRSRGPATDHADVTKQVDVFAKEIRSIASNAKELKRVKLQVDLIESQMRGFQRHGSLGVGGRAQPLGHTQVHGTHVQSPAISFVSNTPSAPEPRSIPNQVPRETRLPAPAVVYAESRPMAEPGESRMLPGFRPIGPAPFSTFLQDRSAGSLAPRPPAPPIVATIPQREPPTAGGGCATVNTNSAPKRTLPSGPVPPHESFPQTSPKRQCLRPLMPHTSYDPQNPACFPYSRGSTNTLPVVSSRMACRNPSNESGRSIPLPPKALRFVQFASRSEVPPDEASRQDVFRTARPMSDRRRESPEQERGGKKQGGRKSTGTEGNRAIPEWVHPDYSKGGYHSQGRGGLVRREGHTRPPTERNTEIYQAGMHPNPHSNPHFMPMTTIIDVASSSMSTKKTRKKPVRNLEGILLRRDGRPDLRSVNGAMNLKKAKLKKQAEITGLAKNTPVDGKEESSAASAHAPHLVSKHDVDTDNTPSSPSAHDHSTVDTEKETDRRQ